jgi:hypothetical protein
MKTTVDHPYLTELRRALDRVRNDPSLHEYAERLEMEINLYEYGLLRLQEEAKAERRSPGLTAAREQARALRLSEIKRRLLLNQLSLKFGVLPLEIQSLLATASLGDLSLWLDRTSTAETLDAIFS